MCSHKKAYHHSHLMEKYLDSHTLSIYKLRGFFIHLLAYVLVNIGLITINLMTNPSYLWFVWPLAGWGIGLVSNALSTPGLNWVLKGGAKPDFLENNQ